MSLIPQITLEKLIAKIRKNEEIPSVEIVEGEKYVGTFIVPSMRGGATIFNEIKTRAEYLGVRGNIVVPPDIVSRVTEGELSGVNILRCECGFEAKSAFGLLIHKRKHKKELHVTAI